MMDAVEFLEKHNRMCGALGDECTDKDGTLCPLLVAARKVGKGCYDYTKSHPAEAVEIVERWAKEHPKKTRQSELLEQFSKMFPRMNQDNFWWRDICPKDIDTKVKCPVCANGMTMHCTDCREIYWLEEVDDDEH